MHDPLYPSLYQVDCRVRLTELTLGFRLMAEVCRDLEWTMLQQGFVYAYDERPYDRLVEGRARPVREHLSGGLDYQDHLARFPENHDEPRAAATYINPDLAHRALDAPSVP